MFPVGDDQVAGGPPKVVTVGLIILNVLAFLLELGQGSEGALQSFIQAWGVVPREYTTGHVRTDVREEQIGRASCRERV